MNKITKTFLFFLAAAIICLAETSCQSSKSAYKSKSSITGRAYVKKAKSKSGNKRSNHRSKSTAASKKAPAKTKSGVSARTASTGKASANGSKSVTVSAQAQQVIKTARKYIGTPYRYGGTTSKGMDCSGLLCTSFKAVDIQLPRVSHEQAKYGTEVRLTNVAPGDLVFFSERKGSGKVSHVGMVTDVRGKNDVKFIHASTSRGVIEDNLYSEYFQRIFVKAIRPF